MFASRLIMNDGTDTQSNNINFRDTLSLQFRFCAGPGRLHAPTGANMRHIPFFGIPIGKEHRRSGAQKNIVPRTYFWTNLRHELHRLGD